MNESIPIQDLILEPLSEDNLPSDFDCTDGDLNEFLLDDALGYQNANVAMTTLARYQEEIVGYFSVGMDCITLASKEHKPLRKESGITQLLPEYPALKIYRLAVCKDYQKDGVGEILVLFVTGLARRLQHLVGVRFISVDAYECSVGFYEKMDFLLNKAKQEKREDLDTVSMRLDLQPISWPRESKL